MGENLLLDRVAYLKLLDVRPEDGYLVVDAKALMVDDADIRFWVLTPEPNGDWTHGPSGVTCPLGSALWSIVSTYATPQNGRSSDG